MTFSQYKFVWNYDDLQQAENSDVKIGVVRKKVNRKNVY